MRRLLAIALALIAAPAAAQDTPAPGPSAPAANQAKARDLLERAEALGRGGDAAGARALIDQALIWLPEPTPQRGYVQCSRGFAYLDADRAVARPAIEECRRLLPGAPIANMAFARLMLADRQIEPAMKAMVQAIRAQPDMMRGCDTSSVGEIATWLRMLNYERLDALRGELVAALIATPCGQDDAAFFSGLAVKTISDRVARDDRAGAAGLLPAVIDPDDMLILLIDRRFDSIRAEIDKQAGPTLVPQREALLQSARNAAARVPTFGARKALAIVLGQTGHLTEAVAALRALIDDTSLNDPDYYLRGSSVGKLAEYMSANGETDVALAVAPMRRLLAAGHPRDHGGLWNVVPTLAFWLLNYGRHREALEVLDQYQPDAGSLDGPGALAYFTALRGCAKIGLGDSTARALLDSVRADHPGNLLARRLAASCNPDAAVLHDELLAIAADPGDTGSTLVQLVRLRTVGVNGKGRPTFEDAAMLRALADPGFAARLDALVRPLPPSYRGALANWN